MRLRFERPHLTIESAVIDSSVELANLVVLSGANGAGKSHLLEAIASGGVRVLDENGVGIPSDDLLIMPPSHPSDHGVRLFRSSQLVAAVEGPRPASQFAGRWAELQAEVKGLQQQFRDQMSQMGAAAQGHQQEEAHVCGMLVGTRKFAEPTIQRLKALAGKDLIDWTEADFQRMTPLLIGVRDPFALTMTELFLTYRTREQGNQFSQWQLEVKGDTTQVPLTDDEFVEAFGPEPWTLMNETLDAMGLPYTFTVPPSGVDQNVTYVAELVHAANGAIVATNELSGGEKTLLAIAMTLYTGSQLGDSIEMPKVLLLDEPDASLHPSMVQQLLRVLSQVFIEVHGIKVFLTTHSPTTVALAPEESLYVMRAFEQPRLKKASTDEALRELTIGIPTLSVKVEGRRQVFVESDYDQQCYQILVEILRREELVRSEFSLEFIASGKRGQGNCVAVRHLVKELRDKGNDSVFGVVDRDVDQVSDGHIVVAPERYSLENFVLDPWVLAVLLVRERMIDAVDLGLPASTRHQDLNATLAQAAVDALTSRIAKDGDKRVKVQVPYAGGAILEIERFWLDTRGHDLEERIVDNFPKLHRFNAQLKAKCVELAMGDVPECIPSGLKSLMEKLLVEP